MATHGRILPYVGGKRRHKVRDVVRARLAAQSFRGYFEPMCGGLAVAEAVASRLPQALRFWDADADLIALYRQMQRDPGELLAQAWTITAALTSKEDFYALREAWNARRGDVDVRAIALQFVLRWATFNGMFRRNKQGALNVPPRNNLVDLRLPALTTLTHFLRFAGRAEFAVGDITSPASVDVDGWLIYVDPPYDNSFAAYTAQGFSVADQVALLETCNRWRAGGATVIITQANTERMRELYLRHGWYLTYVNATRSIACNGDRTPAKEFIATKDP